MMKRQVALLLCILYSVTTMAAAVPQISVDNDIYEFGSVLDGTPVTHTFVLTNVGSQTLRILEVGSFAKCPCTVHTLETDTLEPGDSTDLLVSWDTRGYGGRGYPGMSLYIDSNDPETPRLVVSLEGDVLALGPHHTSVDEVNFIAYVLVDLRSPEAYAEEHIMGAINIPFEVLDDYIGLLSYEHLIIFYDDDGSTSWAAVEKLFEGGYQENHAVDLHGGLSAWKAAHGETWPSAPRSPGGEWVDEPSAPRLVGEHSVTVQHLERWFFAMIDVRTPDQYASGHLIGAVNIPFENLEEYLDLLPANALLVVYDEDGRRSDDAMERMVDHGIAMAQSMIGGISLWQEVFGTMMLWPAGRLPDA